MNGASMAAGRAEAIDVDEDSEDLNRYDREYENEYSWEQLEEDEYGNLRASIDEDSKRRERRRRILTAAESARIRRGMIRYVEIIVDLSRAAAITDMRPVRSAVMFASIEQFLRNFFDENPLSQVGIIVLRNGIAERITELSSSPVSHIEKLRQNLDTGGDASLENGFLMALDSLRHIPPYGHREILVVLASLSTCDPGDVMKSIKACKDAKIRISLIGLSAEVYICRTAAERTGGTYGVATGEAHLDELMLLHAVPPPAASASVGSSLVRMGFPARSHDAPGAATFVGWECSLKSGAYTCPRCKARVGELPAQCHVCGLTLISSPHLARSYHHLFPVKLFQELAIYPRSKFVDEGQLEKLSATTDADAEEKESRACYGCFCALAPVLDERAHISKQNYHMKEVELNRHDRGRDAYRCPDCKKVFCGTCDEYIHEYLHSCPGCESSPPELRDSTP